MGTERRKPLRAPPGGPGHLSTAGGSPWKTGSSNAAQRVSASHSQEPERQDTRGRGPAPADTAASARTWSLQGRPGGPVPAQSALSTRLGHVATHCPHRQLPAQKLTPESRGGNLLPPRAIWMFITSLTQYNHFMHPQAAIKKLPGLLNSESRLWLPWQGQTKRFLRPHAARRQGVPLVLKGESSYALASVFNG